MRCFGLSLGMALLVTSLASTLVPARASADAVQLCRSITAITLAPTDIILSPYISYKDLRYGLEENDDTFGVKVDYVFPGYLFLNLMQIGGAMIRVVAGALEFLPGLFSLPRETSGKPFFQNWADSKALYDSEWGPCLIKIGSSYNATAY